MPYVIKPELAQQIVDSVKGVIERDINFINTKGMITASTDASRIGEFHEAGYEAVRAAEMKQVEDDDKYAGARRGINYPIYVGKELAAVIGITGPPHEVERYGFLITKISEVFLKEQQITGIGRDREQMAGNLIQMLLYQKEAAEPELLEHFSISEDGLYRAVRVRLDRSGETGPLEVQLRSEFFRFGIELFTYIYPNEFLLILNEVQYENIKSRYSKLRKRYMGKLTVGVGNLTAITEIHSSGHFASVAVRSAEEKGVLFVDAEDMNLDILLASLSQDVKTLFTEKRLKYLDAKSIYILERYFANSMSLKDCSDELHIHKNTLQYQLNRVRELTGLDPRVFTEAVELYLAVKSESN